MKNRKLWAILILLLVVVAALFGWSQIRRGFSARDPFRRHQDVVDGRERAASRKNRVAPPDRKRFVASLVLIARHFLKFKIQRELDLAGTGSGYPSSESAYRRQT